MGTASARIGWVDRAPYRPFSVLLTFPAEALRIHRIMGRTYLGAIAVAACFAMYIGYVHTRPAVAVFTFVLALTLLISAAMAFTSIKNGNIQQHRQWMVRSYALMTIFVTSRVSMAIPAVLRAEIKGGGASVLWTLMIATMVVTEIGLSWRAVVAQSGRSKQAAAAGS